MSEHNFNSLIRTTNLWKVAAAFFRPNGILVN